MIDEKERSDVIELSKEIGCGKYAAYKALKQAEGDKEKAYNILKSSQLAEPMVDYPAKKRFFYDVCDKDGNIEMKVWYEPDARPYKFFVHYPRFEISGEKLRDCTCFQRFTREQIGMLVYAYSEEEYWKFEKAFMEWSGKVNEREGN